MANQRTHRIEAVLDRLTAADRALVTTLGPADAAVPPVLVEDSRFVYKPYVLTRPRLAVLQALLAGGPIHDRGGQAIRNLMGRMGRSDYDGTHAVVSGLIAAGMVRCRTENRRLVELEALPEALSRLDRQRLLPTGAGPTTAGSGPSAPPESAVLAGLRAELAATRVASARAQLQLETLQTWARRMPFFATAEVTSSLDEYRPVGDRPPPPNPTAASTTAAPSAVQGMPGAVGRGRPLCHYIYPEQDSIEQRRGQPCRSRAWAGNNEWCWHHDPTPMPDRKASPITTTTAA